MKRNNAIDILKGIGIILVLVAHSLGGFISQFSYTFHMPLFFIVTGLFISEASNNDNCTNFTTHIRITTMKDFKRLVIPAIFTTLFIVLVSTARYIYPDSYLPNPIDLIYTEHPAVYGDNIQMLGNLWFLFALFFAKQYFYILRQCTLGLKSLFILSFVIGGFAIICGWYFTLPLCALVGFTLLPYISIGYIIKKRGGVDVGIPRWVWALVVLWCIYIFYGKLQVGRMEYSWGYFPNVLAACSGTFFSIKCQRL